MSFEARNFRMDDVELNWAKLSKPVSPFGSPQWELQVVVPEDRASELSDNHLNVKPAKDAKGNLRPGFVSASLKRKAIKADGSENGKVRVVNAEAQPMENVDQIGNGSRGNVIVFQYEYSNSGRTGIASSLTAVQVTKLEVYNGGGSSDFEPVTVAATVAPEEVEAPANPF